MNCTAWCWRHPLQNCSSSHKSEWNSDLLNFFQFLSQYVLFQILQFSPPCSWSFFASFFPPLPPLLCVLSWGAIHPIFLFIHQQKKSHNFCSLCDMGLHYPISLTVWCGGRRKLFGCFQHINRGAGSCAAAAAQLCQHWWSTEVLRLKLQTETCTLKDHPISWQRDLSGILFPQQ